MYMDDQGHSRLLPEVVVQIEAEADAHVDPEDGEPDQRSPAIFTRRPGCGCMDVHPLCPPCQLETRTTMGLMRWVHSCILPNRVTFSSRPASALRSTLRRRQEFLPSSASLLCLAHFRRDTESQCCLPPESSCA